VVDWLEARDGHAAASPPLPLVAAVERLLGRERDAMVGRLRELRPGDYATLARPLLAEAGAGDPYARSLLDEAAAHHVRLARALAPSVAEPLALGGGLAPAFAPRLAAALPPGCLAADRAPSPLRGAFLIGIGRAAPEYPSS
jgi:N-acetylglucosamine kinase-like BadF-type ATPase